MIGLNHYSELLEYIRQLALKDPLVKSVTQGDFENLDLKKGQERNLVHVSVTGGGFDNGANVLFNVQLGAFADRRTKNLDTVEIFYGNNNEVSNLNETLAILNRMWSIMNADFEDAEIEATDNPTWDIYWNGATQLDGLILNFQVIMPNTTLSLCQYIND